MSGRNQKTEQTKSSEYSPNPREATAVNKFREEAAKRAPRLKVTKEGNALKVGADHPDNSTGLILLMEALGTTDEDFLTGFLNQLLGTTSQGGKVNEEAVNFMLSVIKGIKPRDQVEAMLAAQMAAVHVSTMTFGRRLAHVETIQQQDSAERAFNKLTRTYTSQMEALKRYRTGGEQKVTVQHVTVGEGGQAIVGNVTQERREEAPTNSVAPLALEDKKMVAMPAIEERMKVPVAARSSKKQ